MRIPGWALEKWKSRGPQSTGPDRTSAVAESIPCAPQHRADAGELLVFQQEGVRSEFHSVKGIVKRPSKRAKASAAKNQDAVATKATQSERRGECGVEVVAEQADSFLFSAMVFESGCGGGGDDVAGGAGAQAKIGVHQVEE